MVEQEAGGGPRRQRASTFHSFSSRSQLIAESTLSGNEKKESPDAHPQTWKGAHVSKERPSVSFLSRSKRSTTAFSATSPYSSSVAQTSPSLPTQASLVISSSQSPLFSTQSSPSLGIQHSSCSTTNPRKSEKKMRAQDTNTSSDSQILPTLPQDNTPTEFVVNESPEPLHQGVVSIDFSSDHHTSTSHQNTCNDDNSASTEVTTQASHSLTHNNRYTVEEKRRPEKVLSSTQLPQLDMNEDHITASPTRYFIIIPCLRS